MSFSHPHPQRPNHFLLGGTAAHPPMPRIACLCFVDACSALACSGSVVVNSVGSSIAEREAGLSPRVTWLCLSRAVRGELNYIECVLCATAASNSLAAWLQLCVYHATAVLLPATTPVLEMLCDRPKFRCNDCLRFRKHSITMMAVNSRRHSVGLKSNDRMPVSRGYTLAKYPVLHSRHLPSLRRPHRPLPLFATILVPKAPEKNSCRM